MVDFFEVIFSIFNFRLQDYQSLIFFYLALFSMILIFPFIFHISFIKLTNHFLESPI